MKGKNGQAHVHKLSGWAQNVVKVSQPFVFS